jgi:hypothetical protein
VWPNVRIALWAHSLASWAAFGVLWLDTLRQPGRPPIDGQFWLVFGLTEGSAPFWLPLSFVLYQPVVGHNEDVTMVAAVYVPVAALTAAWRWRRERSRLRTSRRAAGRCVRCGYDLRATQARCPECGAVAEPPHHPPPERTAAAI